MESIKYLTEIIKNFKFIIFPASQIYTIAVGIYLDKENGILLRQLSKRILLSVSMMKLHEAILISQVPILKGPHKIIIYNNFFFNIVRILTEVHQIL